MQNKEEVLGWAKETIAMEATAVKRLEEQLNEDFVDLVNVILDAKGRVVVTGIGKSAAIGTKIVATLNSTGTPAVFMHAADAVHGDLGMIQKDDIVICISKSGNTPEIKALVPLIKQSGNVLAAMVGDLGSFLAKNAKHNLDVSTDKEACPNNLAPTTSTTAQLAMGDALAVCLLKARGFTSSDFARYHPGGALGKRLYTTLGDLASLNDKPIVEPDATIREVIMELTKKRLGAVTVLNNENVIGVITDGDIRRMLEREDGIDSLTAKDIMGANPISMQSSDLAAEASAIMREKKISQVVVLEGQQYMGMVHIHDLNREGIL
ncbi:MAG: KpsF/GutQ family sugar-phosphate isomerase [Bacteroidetes bacterium]|nr:KpsF/GutQ family sugar-phosphate isomerase [Bacteroidota bacterium]